MRRLVVPSFQEGEQTHRSHVGHANVDGEGPSTPAIRCGNRKGKLCSPNSLAIIDDWKVSRQAVAWASTVRKTTGHIGRCSGRKQTAHGAQARIRRRHAFRCMRSWLGLTAHGRYGDAKDPFPSIHGVSDLSVLLGDSDDSGKERPKSDAPKFMQKLGDQESEKDQQRHLSHRASRLMMKYRSGIPVATKTSAVGRDTCSELKWMYCSAVPHGWGGESWRQQDIRFRPGPLRAPDLSIVSIYRVTTVTHFVAIVPIAP